MAAEQVFKTHLKKYLPLFELLLPLTGAFMLNTISISPKGGLWWHSSKKGQKSDKMTDHRDYM